MGMSTYVYGLKEPTPRYYAMKAIRDNCAELAIQEPEEVERYFEDEYGSDENGQKVNLPGGAITQQVIEGVLEDRWEVDLSKLPPEVIKIRFVNSY